jgi:hypothetical protein
LSSVRPVSSEPSSADAPWRGWSWGWRSRARRVRIGGRGRHPGPDHRVAGHQGQPGARLPLLPSFSPLPLPPPPHQQAYLLLHREQRLDGRVGHARGRVQDGQDGGHAFWVGGGKGAAAGGWGEGAGGRAAQRAPQKLPRLAPRLRAAAAPPAAQPAPPRRPRGAAPTPLSAPSVVPSALSQPPSSTRPIGSLKKSCLDEALASHTMSTWPWGGGFRGLRGEVWGRVRRGSAQPGPNEGGRCHGPALRPSHHRPPPRPPTCRMTGGAASPPAWPGL